MLVAACQQLCAYEGHYSVVADDDLLDTTLAHNILGTGVDVVAWHAVDQAACNANTHFFLDDWATTVYSLIDVGMNA